MKLLFLCGKRNIGFCAFVLVNQAIVFRMLKIVIFDVIVWIVRLVGCFMLKNVFKIK